MAGHIWPMCLELATCLIKEVDFFLLRFYSLLWFKFCGKKENLKIDTIAWKNPFTLLHPSHLILGKFTWTVSAAGCELTGSVCTRRVCVLLYMHLEWFVKLAFHCNQICGFCTEFIAAVPQSASSTVSELVHVLWLIHLFSTTFNNKKQTVSVTVIVYISETMLFQKINHKKVTNVYSYSRFRYKTYFEKLL